MSGPGKFSCVSPLLVPFHQFLKFQPCDHSLPRGKEIFPSSASGSERKLVVMNCLLATLLLGLLAKSQSALVQNMTRPGDVLEILEGSIPLPTPTRTAGIYFSEDLYPGIDDRQIFLLLITLQKLGYFIDFIVTDTNTCQSLHDLQRVINSFPFSLENTTLRLVKISSPRRALSPSLKYQVFVVNGIEKIPPVDGIGLQLNIFVCKFPSDGYREEGSSDRYALWARLKSLSSFDFILVPDPFTYELMVKVLLKSSLRELTQHHRPYPSIYLLPSPALLLQRLQQSISSPPFRTTAPTIITVTLASRHLSSPSPCQQHQDTLSFLLLAQQRLSEQSSLSIHFQLILAMNSPREEESCLPELLPSSSRLTLLSQRNFSHYTSQLSLSDLIWAIPWDPSMFSLKNEILFPSSTTADHPNSWKTFPTVVLDVMIGGAIPILYSDSTTRDLISPSTNGFFANSLTDYITRTVTILTSSMETRERWRGAAKQSASTFKVSRFSNTLKLLMRQYLKSRSFRQFTWTALPILRRKAMVTAAPIESHQQVAVIIEPHVVSTFEYCVKNLLLFIGMQHNSTTTSKTRPVYRQEWALHVHHSAANEVFVKFVLRSIPNVVYHLLPSSVSGSHSQQTTPLFTSLSFWKLYENQQKVLLFQSSTLLIQPALTQFLEYDFITAPPPHRHQQTKTLLLKGGIGSEVKIYDSYRSPSLSLRSPALFVSCLNWTGDAVLTERESVELCSQANPFLGLTLLDDETVSDQFCRVSPVTTKDQGTDHDHFLAHLPFAIEASWEYFSSYEALLYYKASLQAMISCC
jgi:hypothetical protein